jgi:hypothetical protein
MRVVDVRRKQLMTDAQKLGDAVTETASLGEQRAHRRIGHALHRGKNERGARGIDPLRVH